MVSFVSFVLRFKNDNTALGDVAGDMADDPRISKRWGHATLVKHLMRMNATQAVFDVLGEANVYYVTRIKNRLVK